MSNRFRTKIINSLVDEINRLSGSSFEQFGYKIMPLVQSGNWIERGTTIDGAPVGSTVDTSLPGAVYIGEMSSLADYFEGTLAKPKGDLQHAFDEHPQAKHIWLLSSRTASPGQTANIADVISDFKAAHSSLETVSILDAREIAGHIFDHLGSHDLVRSLSHYLPSLVRLAEEHAFSHSIPSVASFAPRLSVEAAIWNMLQSSSYVVLQGMSGIGKTALAARVATAQANQFDNCIWLDAAEITGVHGLKSIQVSRSGVSHNISGLIRNHRMLVVLDDPGFPLSQLDEIEYGKSRIIVTTQVASGPHVIPIVDLDPQEARVVLTSGVSQPCPSDVAARALHSAGGHPLILRALNRTAAEDGWEAVADCVTADSIGHLNDDLHQNIFRRLLRKHADSLAYEIQFVRWLGSRRCPLELARAASPLLVGKLDKRGFMAAASPGYVRVHDLVYSAIQAEVHVSPDTDKVLRERIAKFIRKEGESDRILLQRIARQHDELFARLVAEHRQAEFVYMLALRRTGESTIALLGDPVADASELSHVLMLSERVLEIRSVIEVVEALFTLRVEHQTRLEARLKLDDDIRALSMLLSHEGITDEQRTMLEYHRAKMLLRLERKVEAIGVFRKLLERDAANAAARNQLAKILPRADSIVECEHILRQHVEMPDTVNWNLILDSLRLLARNGADMATHEPLLMATIEHAKGIDSSEAVRLVAAVGQRAWFNAPDLLSPMFAALGAMAVVTAPSEAFNSAQVHKFTFIAGGEAVNDGELLRQALRLYRLAEMTMEYERTHYSEALILSREYQTAIDLLGNTPTPKREAFWLQRHAEALSGLGYHDAAQASIDRAIAGLKDTSLLSDFHWSKFRIRKAARDANASEELALAIALLPFGHPFRKKLELAQSQC